MDTLSEIRDLAAKQSGAAPESIDFDVPIDQLGIDSLGFLEFLFEAEDRFQFPIPPDAVKHVRTLRELATVVDGLAAAAPQPPAAK